MWTPLESKHLRQPIQAISSVQLHPLGDIVRAFEPIHGAGEFIYLRGVAATLAGSLVTYDWSGTAGSTFLTTLDAATANAALLKAFAASPNVAASFGWYQIAGAAVAVNNGTAAVGNAFAKATGQVGSAAVAGTQILGARIAVANGSTFTKVCTTRNGSTTLIVPDLDGLFVGLPVSGTGIPGATVVAAGTDSQPFTGNNTIVLNNAATADGTVTITFTRTNFSIVSCSRPSGQGQIT